MNRSKQAGMSTRTIGVLLIGLALWSIPFAETQAQQLKEIHRIGFLSTQSLSSISTRVDAFRQGLRALGYIEGQNISIEMRSADGQLIGFPTSWPNWSV